MKKAVLHIGTEKTGSTSIQLYLYKNRAQLVKRGVLFPNTCDYLSSRKLVVFAKRRPDLGLIVGLDIDREQDFSLSDWKERFVRDHCQEVLNFQAKHDCDSTVIYSSEHMQSRLTTLEEIRRLKVLLQPIYDQIDVVVYLRRQDRFALSAYSTTLRGGRDSDFTFESVNAAGRYYNQFRLLEEWSEVFGERSVFARVFERGKLIKGDVVADFCTTTGLPYGEPGMETPEPQNEALSQTSQSLLRSFNRLPEASSQLAGLHRGKLRAFLLRRLETITDEYGRCLPERASAKAFMSNYTEANRQVSERWLGGLQFDASFDEYPLQASTLPVIADADHKLGNLIDEFRNANHAQIS